MTVHFAANTMTTSQRLFIRQDHPLQSLVSEDDVTRAAYAVARESLPRYSHSKSPHHFTFPQLAACVLIGSHYSMSYRELMIWLSQSERERVRQILELGRRIPDASTLSRVAKRMDDQLQSLSETMRRKIIFGERDIVAVETDEFSSRN
ncbi:MAG: hypothetical protein KIH69_010290 [Anaerolineae bacterium]|nr:hypothetical protein [Anaerolineae bacterium]